MPDFTIAILEGTYGSGVMAAVDMLAAARELARAVQVPVPTWRVASAPGGPIRLDSGFSVDTVPLQGDDAPDFSTWIIPAIAARSEPELQASLQLPQWKDLAGLVSNHLARGRQVAACGSAAFLPHESDLLAGRRMTTTWWLADLLQRSRPTVRVDRQKALCIDGPVTTCGPAFAQHELMLHLIGQLCGPRIAEQVSLLWLRNGDAAHPAADLLGSFEARDATVARIVASVERSLPESPTISQLAQQLAISERTLSRHVRRITGKSTLALVQHVKLRRARALLERSRMSIDQIAEAVGYSDSTALRRLMKKITGTQPSFYRAACLPA